MKTLTEHNEAAIVLAYEQLARAGVLCPKCKTEMAYEGGMVTQTIPPARSVICPQCGYSGTRLG